MFLNNYYFSLYLMSDKKDKGVLKEIVDFLKASKNFLQACEKPKDGKFTH